MRAAGTVWRASTYLTNVEFQVPCGRAFSASGIYRGIFRPRESAVLAGCFLDELPEKLIGDKAYDADALDRQMAEEYGIEYDRT